MANTSQKLFSALWSSADTLRSKMDANEYKSYLLGIVFYKYLSDSMLYRAAELIGEPTEDLEEAQRIYEQAYNDPEIQADLIKELQYDNSYSLRPELTFTALMGQIQKGEFLLESLGQGFRDLEQSDEMFDSLFDDVDLHARKLGNTHQKKNDTISEVMKSIAPLDLVKYQGDALGDAYEYLISQFASESGKKAGEFYTPAAVAEIMTRIALLGKEEKRGLTIYDPAMGSGSLLLHAAKYSKYPEYISYFGQEVNTSTYNLARMNMMLHRVSPSNQYLRNADTLDQDWPQDEPTNFDMVLMNPPYSAKWSAAAGFLTDPRFSPYGVLAPKSKADFAFLLHGYFHLKKDGTMAIILPHGVLFRGGAEGKIRKALLESGAIDAIIGLPANIFYSTGIPTTILILKKDKESRDVLFIDASKEFTKARRLNELEPEHIQKIIDTYKSREDVEKYAHLASFSEIEENDYNLNIPRYVDTFEEIEVKPLDEIAEELSQTNKELEKIKLELLEMMGELRGTTEKAQEELDGFMRLLSGE